LEEKLKKRKILTERRQGEDIEHEEMSSPRINKKSVQLSYVELPVSNRPYKDENGNPIFLNDNNCYRLQHINCEIARQCIEKYMQKIFGYKFNLKKKLEIVKLDYAYITKTVRVYYTKKIEMNRTFKPMKPNNMTDGFKFHQSKKISKFRINRNVTNEKSELENALLKAKDGLTVIDKSLKFVDCTKCNGFGFERCQFCDFNIANICSECIKLIYKPTEDKICHLKECDLRANRKCVYGRGHRFCRSCLGKGKVFQFASIKAAVDQTIKKECRPSQLLQEDERFKVRTIEKQGLLQGLKMKTEIFANEIPDKFYLPGCENEFVLKYQIVEVELIRVQIVCIKWKKQDYKLYIIGRNNHVVALESIRRGGNCDDSD